MDIRKLTVFRNFLKRRTNKVIAFFVLTTYDHHHILATLPIGHHLEYKN